MLIGVVGWVSSIGVGVHSLLRFQTTPGNIAIASDHWPVEVPLARDPRKPTLVMIVHPNCPCSRASISELAVLLDHCADAMTAYVIFERPTGLVADPSTDDLWRTAGDTRGLHPVEDDGARITASFHAQTSGEVFFYDKAGTLRFTGGITESRGHGGDNAGRSAIEELVTTGATTKTRTPVFGCSLR